MRTRKISWLSKEDKQKIYIMFISGDWYLKEICEMYNVTPYTVEKVVQEINTNK